SSLPLTMPSPHTGSKHPFVQASVSLVLPSSHSSVLSTIPLPQGGSLLQLLEQSSPSSVFPSSQSSLFDTCTNPSPQVARVQSLVQVSVFRLLPSSHSSSPLTMPSPQLGRLQESVQPSVLSELPSSHSSRSSTTPLPHGGPWLQWLAHS